MAQNIMDQKKKKRLKLHEVDLSKDIRYRGPLSYRGFRILGWLCIVVSQVVVLLSLAGRFNQDLVDQFASTQDILSAIASLSVPFLLLADFYLILNSYDSYKMQMMKNGIATGGIILLFLLFYYRYIRHGIMSIAETSAAEADEMIQSIPQYGFQAFNLFLDLLLCTLFMFFLNYRPKNFFTGKKIIFFRLFTILPVAYEVASIVLKATAVYYGIQLPIVLYPFLTVKPPLMFLVFLILATYIKIKEYRFCRYGRTYEEFRTFLKSNRNSLQLSIFLAILLAIVGLLDLFVSTLMINNIMGILNKAELTEEIVNQLVMPSIALGFGDSILLLPLAPFVLLFSYTRRHKNMLIDLLIPIFGVLVIIFLYLEGLHFGFDQLISVIGL